MSWTPLPLFLLDDLLTDFDSRKSLYLSEDVIRILEEFLSVGDGTNDCRILQEFRSEFRTEKAAPNPSVVVCHLVGSTYQIGKKQAK